MSSVAHLQLLSSGLFFIPTGKRKSLSLTWTWKQSTLKSHHDTVLLFLWFINSFLDSLYVEKCHQGWHHWRLKSSSHQEEKDTFPSLLSLDPFFAPKGQFQRRGWSCPPVHVGHLPPARCWDEGAAVPGAWTELAKTAWDKDLPPTHLAVCDYLSWRRKLLDPVTKALHHSTTCVVWSCLPLSAHHGSQASWMLEQERGWSWFVTCFRAMI